MYCISSEQKSPIVTRTNVARFIDKHDAEMELRRIREEFRHLGMKRTAVYISSHDGSIYKEYTYDSGKLTFYTTD